MSEIVLVDANVLLDILTADTPLLDFYIGAHAEAAGHRLRTRDDARYASYFPKVTLVSPRTQTSI